MRRRLWLIGPAMAAGLTLAAGGLAPQAGAASSGPRHASAAAAGHPANPFCQKLGKRYQASAGAWAFCRGAQKAKPAKQRAGALAPGTPRNVDAASPAEDVSPAGLPGQGQSETSIAAAGPYVVEAWNDATGFVSRCPSPMSKEELTGFGFSANGGKSFTDLGGVPNPGCHHYLLEGDPSVVAYRVGGQTYFYISSLYDSVRGTGLSELAVNACKVTGSGGSATLSCGKPVVAAVSSQCETLGSGKHKTTFCSFLDKEYLALDPAHGRLYVSYSDFLFTSNFGTAVDLAACDLGNPAGGRGPAGGTPAAPVCRHGSPQVKVSKHLSVGKPYLTLAPPDPRGCENEGAYPAADPRSHAVYVAYEYNLDTAQFIPACQGASTPLSEVLTKAAAHCLQLATVSPCAGASTRTAVPIVSLSSTIVPGYNRGFTNDFPHPAVSDRYRTVSMVWNDSRYHPLGDILLQSFRLSDLHPVQAKPLVVDRPHHGGLSMFPAVRWASRSGRLDVSWYSRASAQTVNTDVDAALGVSPLATATPPNVRITNVATNWINDSSLIVPNFGDYTDNAVTVTGHPPYVGSTVYFAWSDGRLGIPQPFEAHLPAH
jgi:hypothetical protein